MLIIISRHNESEWPWILVESELEETSGHRIQGAQHLEEIAYIADWIGKGRIKTRDPFFPYAHSPYRNWRAVKTDEL
jgi:hypothetical protein